jgi:hypothetical protein
MALRILVGIAIPVVILIMTFEIRGWRAGTRVVSRNQKVLRASSGVILILAMEMVFVGDGWVRASFGAAAALAYWSFCIGLVGVLIVLSLLDVREITRHFGEERKRMCRRLLTNSGDDEQKPDVPD